MKKTKKLMAAALSAAMCISGGIIPAMGCSLPAFAKEEAVTDAAADVFELSASKNGVTEFLKIAGLTETEKSGACYKISPDEMTETYGYSVFKFEKSYESFLLCEGKVYKLGESEDGNGVMSLAVGDLNEDGFSELYFTYSYGFTAHVSTFGFFDGKTAEVTDFMGYEEFRDRELAFRNIGGYLTVCSANVPNCEMVYGYSIGESPVAKDVVAKIVCADGKITVRGNNGKEIHLATAKTDPALIEKVPEWFPKTNYDTVEFFNDHGNSYVQDNYIFYYHITDPLSAWAQELCVDYSSDILPIYQYQYKYGEVACFRMDADSTLLFTDPDGRHKFVSDADGNITEEYEANLNGDANGDGKITVADAVMLKRWMLGSPVTITAQNMDLHEDGVIDIYDFVVLRRMIKNGEIRK